MSFDAIVKKFILLVDDQGRIESVLGRALKGSALGISSYTDVTSAKRSLLEGRPLLIMTAGSFQDDADGGFRLSAEVAHHAELSQIPLVIVSEDLNEEIIHRATQSGAKSLIPWPIAPESLRNRLKSFLASELEPQAASADLKPVSAAEKVAAVEAAAAQHAAEKVKVAQHLLAKVLHNLKTSDLLEVIDLEDVPRVVFEITRAVCDVPAAAKPAPSAKQPASQNAVAAAPTKPAAAPAKPPPPEPPKPAPEPETSIDLDAIFNLKK